MPKVVFNMRYHSLFFNMKVSYNYVLVIFALLFRIVCGSNECDIDFS